jgi:hypothetical protein
VKSAASLKILFVLIIGTSFVVGTLGLTLLSVTTPTTDVYGQAGNAVQNIKATYAVSIVPGAAQRTNPIHYYPPVIAVPMGTTVAWLNNDPEQPHTVTSGLPGASLSGALFNSGIMPPGGGDFIIDNYISESQSKYTLLLYEIVYAPVLITLLEEQ